LGRNYIKQLTVGGFQVFADPVSFPLGPLTLLYGPNSAGKSAILDAMLALADLCELWVPTKPATVSTAYSRNNILGRHWRRQGVMPTVPAESLKLGALIRVAGREWALAGFASPMGKFSNGVLEPKDTDYASCFSVLQPLANAEHVDIGVLVRCQLSDRESLPIARHVSAQEQCIEISLGGAPVLRLYEHADLACLNLDHAALTAWKAVADLKWIGPQYDDAFALDGGWFGTKISSVTHGFLQTNAFDHIEPRLSADVLKRVHIAEALFISMFDALFRATLRSACDALRVALVPASRTVPRTSEVTYLLTADATPISGDSVGLQLDSLPEHLEVTRAAFVSEMERCGLREPPTGFFGEHTPRSSKNPVDLVNRLLSDYLFRSSGYFVAAGIHELTPLGSAGPHDTRPNTSDVGRKYLVSLELHDSAGRRLHFDEVGSGLGYVLPVLLAVATSNAVFVQQPELHLHPALQSELADALIMVLGDAGFGGIGSKGCSQIIAETHSEHLLLRLLRRVRQAAAADRSLDPHSLGREELVVLYVDPKPNGASTVKHLRIARDGEFIDRWPKGFFEERWTELFDE
jgi:hypothetical protein